MKILRLNSQRAGQELDALLKLSESLAGAPHWPRAVWQQMTATIDASSEQAGRLLLAAFEAEKLTGFLLCSYVAGEAEIESIAVSELQQRRGVGRALLGAAVEELKGLRSKEIRLEVRASNTKAAEFYRALGFELRGRRAGYYADPIEDAILLSRPL